MRGREGKGAGTYPIARPMDRPRTLLEMVPVKRTIGMAEKTRAFSQITVSQ